MGDMGNFGYVASVIVMCLAVAALCGALLTYLWRRASYRRMYANSEQSWLSRLRQTEQDRDSRIARLTSEVEEHRHQVPTMERSLAERSDIISALESTIDTHKETNKKLELELKSALGGVESSGASQQKMAKLEGDLEESRFETGNLNRELDKLRAKHNEANARATSAEKELVQSKEQHVQQQALFKEQEGTAGNAKFDASEKRVGELKGELSGLNSRYSRLEQEHSAAQAQLQAAATKLKEALSTTSQFNDREQKLTDRLGEQDKELSALRAQVQEEKHKLQKAQQESGEMTGLKHRIDALRHEANGQGEDLAQSERQRSELEQALRARTESLSQVEKKYSELTTKLAGIETLNTQNDERHRRLAIELEDAQLKALEADEEVSKWRSQAQKLENKLQSHEATSRESVQQSEYWQSEHDKLKAQTSNQQAQTSEMQRENAALKQTLNDAKTQAQAEHNKYVDVQKRLDDQEGQLSAEIRRYKLRISELEKGQEGSAQAAEEAAMLRRTLEQRDGEFALERQKTGKQRELASDWQSRYEALKIEHDRVLSLPKSTSGKKAARKKSASSAPLEKPKWLLDKAPDEKDDLKKIWGVGPVMEKTMNGLGIYLFKQVASLRKKDIDWVASHINTFPDRINRDDWAGQAAKFHKEKYGR